jgi:formylglycine-generating enzyme required for sulfatase activity
MAVPSRKISEARLVSYDERASCIHREAEGQEALWLDMARRYLPSLLILLLITLAACTPLDKEPDKFDDMVLVPSGSFPMGVDGAVPDDEGPQHVIYLEAFWIDLYEVTNDRYRECVDASICFEPKDLRYFQDPAYANHPVVFVSWYDADSFCRWMGKRLPTEAEWEKAARGSSDFLYPWGNNLNRERLNADNAFGGTTPIGCFPKGKSPYGALDMAGNVWEWVSDWYKPYPGSSFHSDFFGEKYKVVRGGSWNHPAEDARTDHRDIAHPARAMGVVGFRCVVQP